MADVNIKLKYRRRRVREVIGLVLLVIPAPLMSDKRYDWWIEKVVCWVVEGGIIVDDQ
mgnify:CR=1 FL=1